MLVCLNCGLTNTCLQMVSVPGILFMLWFIILLVKSKPSALVFYTLINMEIPFKLKLVLAPILHGFCQFDKHYFFIQIINENFEEYVESYTIPT